MRARLILKLMGIIMTLVLTVVAAHSCSASSSSGSLLNPANVERYGLNGLCANQEAVAAAAGSDSPQSLAIPASAGALGGVAGSGTVLRSGAYQCSTTTTG